MQGRFETSLWQRKATNRTMQREATVKNMMYDRWMVCAWKHAAVSCKRWSSKVRLLASRTSALHCEHSPTSPVLLVAAARWDNHVFPALSSGKGDSLKKKNIRQSVRSTHLSHTILIHSEIREAAAKYSIYSVETGWVIPLIMIRKQRKAKGKSYVFAVRRMRGNERRGSGRDTS